MVVDWKSRSVCSGVFCGCHLADELSLPMIDVAQGQMKNRTSGESSSALASQDGLAIKLRDEV